VTLIANEEYMRMQLVALSGSKNSYFGCVVGTIEQQKYSLK